MSLVDAVAASAACAVVAVIIFIWLLMKLRNRWVRKTSDSESFRREEMGITREEFKKLGKNIKGVIVEERGVDVLYMRKVVDGRLTDVFTTVVMNPSYEHDGDGDEEEEKRVDEDGVLMEEIAESTSAPATLPPLVPPRPAYLPPPDPPLKLTSSLQPPPPAPPSQPPRPSTFNKKSYCFGSSASTIIR